MIAAAVALGALALALAWPVPVALSRAEWPARSPATALALWQGIALGGGLAMIGALLAFGASPAGSLTAAASALLPVLSAGPIPDGFGVVHLAALTLAVGLFATKSGLFYGHGFGQTIAQLKGIGMAFAWAFPVSIGIFLAIKHTVGLRVSEEDEIEGLDVSEHGSSAYHGFLFETGRDMPGAGSELPGARVGGLASSSAKSNPVSY